MSKQIQQQSACHHSSGDISEVAATTFKYEEVDTEDLRWFSSSSAPEISIFPAEGEGLEIDSFTGLPKLPVEPLPPGSPDVVRKQPSALKMSSSPVKRKSVSFVPDASKPASPPKSMSKAASSSSVVLRGEEGHSKQSKRANGRPTSLPNRSRSVLIRLQPPKSTPTLPHKRIIGKSDSLPHGIEEARLHDQHRQSRVPVKDQESEEFRMMEADEFASGSPVFSRWNNQPFGRRSSFLYMADSGDHNAGGGGGDDDDDYANSTNYMGGEDYVTPFAQILSTLHRVRADYLALVGLPETTQTKFTKSGWTPTPNPTQSRRPPDTDASREKMAKDLLFEMDWSLSTLEKVNANESMGHVTGVKFKKLLNRELSHLSENSEKGAQVAEWVTNITNPDPYDVDRALGCISQPAAERQGSWNYESSLSVSMSHDNWIRHRNVDGRTDRGRKVTIESESIPTYGVDDPGMDKDQMKEYMTTKLYEWEVDAFHFNTISGGNALVSTAYILFKKRNFFSEFQISPHAFINYMTAIQSSYHAANPYHNAVHAADVLLTTNKLISADNLEGVFTGVEVMAALIAAAVHDVDHPGVTNQFLVAIRHDLAIMYNDISVLENHHVATAFRTLQKPNCNFLQNLDTDCVQLFRKVVIDMVLSTDMGRHIQHVAEMKTLMETKKLTNDGMLSLDNYSESSSVLKCLIHCADLSNPMKPPHIAANWSYRIMEENFKQGDREKELGIPVHAMGDRDVVAIPKCQISFIDFIVYPLWETWAELVYPHAQNALDNITTTKNYWCTIAKEHDSNEERGLERSILEGDSSSDSSSDEEDHIDRNLNLLGTKHPSKERGGAQPRGGSEAGVAGPHGGSSEHGGTTVTKLHSSSCKSGHVATTATPSTSQASAIASGPSKADATKIKVSATTRPNVGTVEPASDSPNASKPGSEVVTEPATKFTVGGGGPMKSKNPSTSSGAAKIAAFIASTISGVSKASTSTTVAAGPMKSKNASSVASTASTGGASRASTSPVKAKDAGSSAAASTSPRAAKSKSARGSGASKGGKTSPSSHRSGEGGVTETSGGELNLSHSADSTTLQAAFKNSPANERRTSYKSYKQCPVLSLSSQD